MECLPDVSCVSLQSDADVTLISDSVLPQYVSMTDLLANSLDQLEESSAHQDTTVEVQQHHELQVNSYEHTYSKEKEIMLINLSQTVSSLLIIRRGFLEN